MAAVPVRLDPNAAGTCPGAAVLTVTGPLLALALRHPARPVPRRRTGEERN
ncbi:hypothetical protein AB0D86_34065 [Streptomyces sp. NPDC048324]|uniref:hypothetical protein n=1 Tax=Streptomyces sp. NPDC048324 TaxID=3157205 RepID=UPI003419C093